MFSLSLLYFIPAGVLLVVSLLWLLRGRLPKTLAVLPVWTPYAMCGLMLVLGGLLHRVAHVQLHGMEIDLANGDAPGESIVVIGGSSGGQRPERGLTVNGLPPEALGIKAEKNRLKIVPGPGYERGILVRSGGRIIPLELGGVPRLTGLRSGDRVIIPPTEGGEMIADWRLGKGLFDLKLTATQRWLGSEGSGSGKLAGLPPKVAALRAEGNVLTITPGDGLQHGLGLCLNGRRLDFSSGQEVKAYFIEGVTRLALVKADPLTGSAVLGEQSPLRRAAWVDWTSADATAAEPKRTALAAVLTAGQNYTAGGGIRDAIFLKGLPPAALAVTISQEGRLRLEMTKAGLDAVRDATMPAQSLQECGPGGEITIGAAFSPSGGMLRVTGPGAAPAVIEPASPAESPAETAASTEGDIDAEPAAPTVSDSHWQILFLPNDATRMPLANRVITLPLMERPLEIYSRRPWEQRLFPLCRLSPRESTLRSAFVYGVPHPDYSINAVSLLQLEPGLIIERNSKPLTPPDSEIGIIENGAPLEILRVLTTESGREPGNVTAQPIQPGAIQEGRRVTVLQQYASVRLDTGSADDRKPRAVLHVLLKEPQTRGVPMSDVKRNLEERDMKGLDGVKFGINDRYGLSDLPHQLTFPGLTKWFDEANADVEMNFSTFSVQDDYARRTLDYGEPFTIGGTRRLKLSLTKETVPLSQVVWVGLAGLIALVTAWRRADRYWWVALLSGTGFLTCSRVLFGQAALVNAPYNHEVIRTAMVAVVAVPLVIGIGGWLMRGLLPGRIEGWLRRSERISYRGVALLSAILLIVRVLLLLAGAKESITIGFRFALSLVFVPAWLILMAQTAFIMWRQKEAAGGFTTPVALRFLLATLWLFGCQAISALVTSDLGMFLYFIPAALLLAAVGGCTAVCAVLAALRLSPAERKSWRSWVGLPAGLAMLAPLASMALIFLAPQWTLGHWPGLMKEMASEEQIVTDSTLLRVLQFADEDYLINIGTDTAERIAQDHAIMDSYAHRGLTGEGYLQVDVLPAKAVTALNDNVSAIYIFAQFGVLGAVAVVLAYMGVLAAGLGARGAANTSTTWLALLAGLSFASVSVYMMLANRGHLPFTGRNMYLLGLNSWSDIVEGLLLAGFIMLGLCRAEFHRDPVFAQSPAAPPALPTEPECDLTLPAPLP